MPTERKKKSERHTANHERHESVDGLGRHSRGPGQLKPEISKKKKKRKQKSHKKSGFESVMIKGW